MNARAWPRYASSAGIAFLLLAYAWFVPPVLAGAPISLTLASGNVNLGGIVSLDLNLASLPGSEPAGIEWTLEFPAGDIVALNFQPGPALSSAGKSIYCNQRVGAITCLGVGLNSNRIGNGIAAVATLTIAPVTASSILPLAIGGTSAVRDDGTAVSSDGNDATVTIQGWQPGVPAYFTDVPGSNPDFAAVNLLYAAGFSKGCLDSPLMYCPDRNLIRGEMAVLLVRTTLGGDPTSFNQTPYFADVPSSHPYFPWIQSLFELGITNGCAKAPLKFCPDRTVTRAEIAAFTVNARYGGIPFANSSIPYFTDVPGTDIYFASIQKMAELGIRPCHPLLYCRDDNTTRGEIAGFLVRGLLNNLLPAGAPTLSVMGPAVVSRGGPPVPLSLTGTNTHFASGLTLNAGAGITVSGLVVVDQQTILANFSADPSATLGPRSLVVTSDSGEVVLPNGLIVQ